jgi:hypothetical protein
VGVDHRSIRLEADTAVVDNRQRLRNSRLMLLGFDSRRRGRVRRDSLVVDRPVNARTYQYSCVIKSSNLYD